MEEIEKEPRENVLNVVRFSSIWKISIVCPNCGADVNSLLTNVSKRGRPPKAVKLFNKLRKIVKLKLRK